MSPNLRRAARLLSASIPLWAAGCGIGAYQDRIAQNTVPLFSYLQDLNSNLGGEIRRGDVRFRLPSAFTELPAPKKPKPGETAPRDSRLPPGLGGDLPGMVSGSRGKMKAEVDGKTREVQVYAYVLTNRYLLSSREASAKPKDYDKLLLNAIASGLGVAAQPNWQPKPYPVGGKDFEPAFRYDAVAFEAGGDAPMRYEVYIRRQDPLVAAMVFVVPKNPARDEQLKKRIDLSLQTLRIERADAGGAAAAPAAGGAAGGAGGSTSGPGF